MIIIEKLRNIIGYYHWLFLARKGFKIIRNYNLCLRPGYYYVSCNVRSYLYRKDTPEYFLEMIGVDISKPKLLAFCVKKQKESIDIICDVVMTTNEGFRFYNTTEKTTLHLFESEEEACLYRKCYSLFSPFFSLTISNITEAYSIENIIYNRHRKDWSKEELRTNYRMILENYSSYLRTAEKFLLDIRTTIKISDAAGGDYISLCKDLLEEIKPISNIIYVFSHGDLHLGNILFDGEKQYLIDFEKARNEVFYYDLFNVIYVEATDYGNYSFLNEYLDGKATIIHHFEKAFDAVGELFDIKQRIVYLKLFLLLRLNYDVEYYLLNNFLSKSENKISVIKDFKRYIDNYINNEF